MITGDKLVNVEALQYVYDRATNVIVPVEKTNLMTQPVGKDANGKLWTVPVQESTIVSATENWLSNNISQDGDYIIDESLSIPGAVADAKVVGDEIGGLKGNVNQLASLHNTTNTMAQRALERAINAESEAIETTTHLDATEEKMASIQAALDGKIDGAYVEDGYLILTINGEPTGERLGPFAGNGGGGGGSGGNNATIRVVNTSGWTTKTIAQNENCSVTFTWSSIEEEMPTGDGSLKITVNGAQKALKSISQGTVIEDISAYLDQGANTVSFTVKDIYENSRTIRMTITVVALVLTSNFDTSIPFSEAINFTYTPTGNVNKLVHFELDGEEIDTVAVNVSGRQQSYTIPQQSHGVHSLRCYFEAEVNGTTVNSNDLYYELICIEPGNKNVILTSTFRKTTSPQYEPITINYMVYDPTSISTPVTISVNDTVVSNIEIDRSLQPYTYRPNDSGTLTIKIEAGTGRYATSKTWEIEITPVQIDVHPETEGLVLHLTTQGRSNSEETREEWAYEDISATLSNFNWRINGWMQDSEGIGILRLNDDARVTIPYQPFASNFIQKGKTIEIEFATREVADYSSTILSCMSDNIGIQITPQNVFFNGAQTKINTQYKENEHIRLTITVGKQNDYRLILIYINGIMSRAIQYASGERFSQLNPVDITIGSNDCGIDLYSIRIYDQDLTARGVLDNWIADTQNGILMQNRYNRNNVYSSFGDITAATLPLTLPYMIIECPQLPQYKGDKKTCSGRFVDMQNESRSFSFEGCQINVQGTSSAIYYRKNWDLQFKGGFVMANGTEKDSYALRPGSIPFNRFVLKADVASSEGTNNTGLTMFYNDTCPYKTPEMREDSTIRWGIEGIPIVLFWYNPDTGETEFLGKHNFNLPKRAPAPYGYADDDTLESWEFERNNSDNVKFKDFDITSQTWDETEQAYYPTWYDDWEARFPSDEWRDTAQLEEFVTWVRSTDREQCTNATLNPSVTYTVPTIAMLTNYSSDSSYTVTEIKENGVRTGYSVTFTKDTPAYRITKFRAEASQYMEMESAEFYYLFTELFLMIDSRAKNMFIGFNGSPINDSNRAMKRKITFQPYDMDTAIGTNNSGVLMFGYSLEDTDTVSSVISGEGGSNAPVFNAQDSVLWVNERDAFRAENMAMYRSLRASKAWSYEAVETAFERHQSAWSEAIYNEDARAKYLIPLINPVTVDEDTGELIRTDRYLTMLQGSKAEQRKWWLYNRFRYMDSKFNTGDASAKTINLRLFNSGTLTINPVIDLYAAVSFGGGTTPSLQRTTAETPVTFTYTAPSGVTEMETWIYSADLIADVGDLSGFYPNELDFSKATRLRKLKIGSATEGYANNNLVTLDVRNSSLLEEIDCRNCPRLAIPINLEGSPRLKEAYFEGTAITSIELVDGGIIETLHLPSTITNLTLLNLDKLTDLEIPSYENITTLMLANIPTEVLNPLEVLADMPAHSQINIQGFYLEAESAEEIEDIFDLFDSMGGVTREKNSEGQWIYHEYDTAQISGTIHIGSLTGAQIASFNERYPYIRVQADHTTSYLYYYNYDGTELLHVETIYDGGNGSWDGAPARTADAQYSYAFAGWSSEIDDDTVETTATQNIILDRYIYPVYIKTIQKYTVTWKNNNGTILETDTEVPYGTIPQYNSATPTYQGQSSTGWEPAISAVTGNVTYTAVYLPTYTVYWKNNNGTTLETDNYVVQGRTTQYNGATPVHSSGDTERYEFIGWSPDASKTPVTTNMECIAIYKDKASIVVKYLEKKLETYESNTASVIGSYSFYQATNLINVITSATTIESNAFYGCTNLISVDFTASNAITIGSSAFANCNKMNELFIRSNSVSTLSSTNSLPNTFKGFNSGVIYVKDALVDSYKSASNWNTFATHIVGISEYPKVLDFSTINDSWEQIIAASTDGSYDSKYNIGDIKLLIDSDNNPIYMELVAKDIDQLSDDSGTAHMTWMTKEIPFQYQMNSGLSNTNGWIASKMRAYLINTYLPKLTEVISAIKEVKKTWYDYTTKTTKISNDTIWIPSTYEMFTESGAASSVVEDSGVQYTKFNSNNTRIKDYNGSAAYYWLRSAYASHSYYFYCVSDSGSRYSNVAYNSSGAVFGFCI